MDSKYIPNSFQLPNAIVDELMSIMSPNALKCYLLIVRKTVGWQKELDYISTSQFLQKTGIKNDSTIFSALHELESLNLIERFPQEGKPTGFKLKTYPPEKIGYPKNSGTPKNEVTPTRKIRVPTYPKNSGTQNITPQNTKNTLSTPKEIDFQSFKKYVIQNFQNVTFGLDAPNPLNYLPNTPFIISQTGYLHNQKAGADLAPEEAKKLWAYLFSKKTQVIQLLSAQKAAQTEAANG